jgi:mRNA interferase HicA
MNGSELIKILRKIGKKQARAVRIDKKRGKGSHFTLYFGVKHTIMKDRPVNRRKFCITTTKSVPVY